MSGNHVIWYVSLNFINFIYLALYKAYTLKFDLCLGYYSYGLILKYQLFHFYFIKHWIQKSLWKEHGIKICLNGF